MIDQEFITEYSPYGSREEAEKILKTFGPEIERDFYLALALWAIKFAVRNNIPISVERR